MIALRRHRAARTVAADPARRREPVLRELSLVGVGPDPLLIQEQLYLPDIIDREPAIPELREALDHASGVANEKRAAHASRTMRVAGTLTILALGAAAAAAAAHFTL
jgi:hypothetical protein